MVSRLRLGAFLDLFDYLKNSFSEDGATAIEYGLIAAAISVAITLSLFLFGDQLQAVLQNIVTVIANVNANLD